MNNNLIMNSQWCADEKGGPQYFSDSGPFTYDNFCVNGNRTCSITMTRKGTQAVLQYNLPIPIQGQQNLMFGCTIRCIGVDCCYLQVDFYDTNNRLIDSCKNNITTTLSADFNTQMTNFPCPCNACTARCSIHFQDRITACTFCAPFAYYC